MTTTPNAIKRLSNERRKDMIEILETIGGEADDVETIEDLKDLFAIDGGGRATEGIDVPDEIENENERKQGDGDEPAGDEVVM